MGHGKSKAGLIVSLKRMKEYEERDNLSAVKRKAVAKIRQSLDTPVTLLTGNERQVSAFLDRISRNINEK